MSQKISNFLMLTGTFLVLLLLASFASSNNPAFAVTNSNVNATGSGTVTGSGSFTLTASVANNIVTLSWTKYTGSGAVTGSGSTFKYYKIVRSYLNPNPTYPADKVMYYYTDVNVTTHKDFAPFYASNYYRVVVVLENGSKIESNAIKVVRDNLSFKDMLQHWAERYVFLLKLKGIIEGRGPDKYDPDAPVTRAEAVKIILKALKINEDVCNESLFEDVPKAEWYCALVTKAQLAGIVKGVGNRFLPNQPMNRAEAMKVLLLAKGIDIPEPSKIAFVDVPLDAWYAKFVNKAFEKGIVQGVGNNKFEPGRYITRAELAKIAALIAEYLEEKE